MNIMFIFHVPEYLWDKCSSYPQRKSGQPCIETKNISQESFQLMDGTFIERSKIVSIPRDTRCFFKN